MSPVDERGDRTANRVPEIVGASVTLIVLPTVFVFLRLLSRRMAGKDLWWDDYTAMMALILSWGPNFVNLVGIHHGFGRHLLTLPVDSVIFFFKNLYAFGLFYCFAMASVKYSIIMFQYRIFPVVRYRRLLILCSVFVGCLTLSCALVSVFMCTPIHDFWDTKAGTSPGAKCINVSMYFIISGGINAGSDFVLLAMPIPLLWKLRTGKVQKLILTGIFGVGLLVCTVSFVRLILLSSFNAIDVTYYYVSPAIWSAAEPSIGVVSACLPSIRPLFARVMWSRRNDPRVLSSSDNDVHSNSSRHMGQYRTNKDGSSGGFDRLQDGSEDVGEYDIKEPWRYRARIRGGRTQGEDRDSEAIELGKTERKRRSSHLPKTGIRVTTTFTVTKQLDWLDDLY